MRRGLLIVVLVIGATQLGSSFAGAGTSGCPDDRGCWWLRSEFRGEVYTTAGAANENWVSMDGFTCCAKSAKNRFNNRTFRLRNTYGSNSNTIVRCLDPGERRDAFPDAMVQFRISQAGNRC